MGFLVVLALATAMTVPVVGALLIFSLMIGPPAAARSITDRPLVAIGFSVALALLTVWLAIRVLVLDELARRFLSVGAYSAFCYGVGRGFSFWRQRHFLGPLPGDLAAV